MTTVVEAIKEKMARVTEALEVELNADVLAIVGPILSGVEYTVRNAIDALPSKRAKVGVVLHTGGGSIEIAERIVNTIRHHYSEVVFIVPDVALSAGTILAMSGDAIMMDYFSCLGPIDPQVERDGKLVPALSYLEQFNRLTQKALAGTLTTPDLALLNKLDLAELHTFEQARELTTDLLVDWLTNYKFKDWSTTATQGIPVTQEYKQKRAREIASALSNHQRWRSHGRGISMRTLRSELNLVIDDFGATPEVARLIRQYFDFVISCMTKEGYQRFVTSREYV